MYARPVWGVYTPVCYAQGRRELAVIFGRVYAYLYGGGCMQGCMRYFSLPLKKGRGRCFTLDLAVKMGS